MTRWSLKFDDERAEDEYWLGRWNTTKALKIAILIGIIVHNTLTLIELVLVREIYDFINVSATVIRWFLTILLCILFMTGPYIPSRKIHSFVPPRL